jgi:hypothetical protein
MNLGSSPVMGTGSVSSHQEGRAIERDLVRVIVRENLGCESKFNLLHSNPLGFPSFIPLKEMECRVDNSRLTLQTAWDIPSFSHMPERQKSIARSSSPLKVDRSGSR